MADVDAGEKPAFGIVEVSTGQLVSDPGEELGDVSRPEETVLWSPDSKAYALTSRVGTRHLGTFLYRWDGKAFVRATWEGGGRLESLADAEMDKDKVTQGLPADAALGRCIRGDDLAERWLDPNRIILTRVQEYLADDEENGAIVTGGSRVIVRWDGASSSYRIERELAAPAPRPPYAEDAGAYDVVQSDQNGDDPNARTLTVTHRETGKSLTFEAENWLTVPYILASTDEWPQLELLSHGPAEFQLRRLYRVVDGAYRCARIDETTRRADQAPEAAARIEIEPGFAVYHLGTRIPEDGDSGTYESFQTETPSPDEKWKAVFTYHPQYLQRAEIVSADGGDEPTILYDFDDGEGGPETVASVLWSPDSASFALFLQNGPRLGYTLLYRASNRVWSQAARPEIDYGFLKGLRSADATWGTQLEQPLWWNSPGELVVELSGHFLGEKGFDYRALATMTWNEDGKPAGISVVEQAVGTSD